ncbi:hypothetical protein CEXT_609391 [Caerostris extrusa]|uniref:Uncharacterized protein n=1 Tax=Caerostris extrusa TaxID=172846 RepID=A0AAV4YD67_CAEEX|nr:hypothetical protein CEXT_609391 [Caerostris extrusa]
MCCPLQHVNIVISMTQVNIVSCINCDKYDHIALWRGCIKYPKTPSRDVTGQPTSAARNFASKPIDKKFFFLSPQYLKIN